MLPKPCASNWKRIPGFGGGFTKVKPSTRRITKYPIKGKFVMGELVES